MSFKRSKLLLLATLTSFLGPVFAVPCHPDGTCSQLVLLEASSARYHSNGKVSERSTPTHIEYIKRSLPDKLEDLDVTSQDIIPEEKTQALALKPNGRTVEDETPGLIRRVAQYGDQFEQATNQYKSLSRIKRMRRGLANHSAAQKPTPLSVLGTEPPVWVRHYDPNKWGEKTSTYAFSDGSRIWYRKHPDGRIIRQRLDADDKEIDVSVNGKQLAKGTYPGLS